MNDRVHYRHPLVVTRKRKPKMLLAGSILVPEASIVLDAQVSNGTSQLVASLYEQGLLKIIINEIVGNLL